MRFLNPNQQLLAVFLKEVNHLFPVPLSERRDLGELAEKIYKRGHCLLACNGEKVMGGISWYDNDTVTRQSYVNILAVLPQYQGHGVAGALLEKVISMQPPHIDSIRLRTQTPIALHMYIKRGFVLENPDDDEQACVEHGCYLIKQLRSQTPSRGTV